jgi:hypothetical protein
MRFDAITEIIAARIRLTQAVAKAPASFAGGDGSVMRVQSMAHLRSILGGGRR